MTTRLDQPLDQAMASTRRAAAELGWKLDEGKSDETTLVFKGDMFIAVTVATLSVGFAAASPTETRLTAFSKEAFVLVDWGRGGRAIKKLFDALGAHLH
jgi:hypothetical protein